MGQSASTRRRAVLGIVLAAGAAVAASEVAAMLLRPGGEVLDPLPVSAGDYFSEAELARAEDFRSGQRVLYLATLAAQGGLLALVVLRPPARLRGALGRLDERPLLGGLAVGAGLAAALAAVSLPTGIWSHERAVDVGLSTQALGGWLFDAARSAGIDGLMAGAGAALLLAAIRRLPRAWPVAAAAGTAGLAVIFVWLTPVILAPVFNRFEELPKGPVRSDVLDLADRAGVDVGEVYTVDASRRSTALNAYVDGLGPTKRIVLFDNLVERADRAELRSVVAHELAHQRNADLQRGLAFFALVSIPAFFLVAAAAGPLAVRSGGALGSPSSLPALTVALALATVVVTPFGNNLSRDIEAKADTTALELTDDPQALIGLQRRLAGENVSDPDPPAWAHRLFGTHPTTLQRIGAALAWQRQGRP